MAKVDPNAVVRCHGCSKWVRFCATDIVGTIEEGDFPLATRWCLKCLNEVDEATKDVIENASDYPLGLPEWDLEEGNNAEEENE